MRKSALHVTKVSSDTRVHLYDNISIAHNELYIEPHFFHGVSFQLYTCLLI